ncbi:hypothetical protein EIN_491300 [Entamoeba invadens IP1]|uniref:Leucine rich repeat containing protein BspA family protein n=1 Tax=Entamoeba invadens IP1 TaxID=370355 RepID=A0A0A1U7E6_ENTIV|nr:hypothetical protein EIN_491300 [Entamoeba invadens IP1]ELP88961.1 hypothetical protein EIN_491300 [Entamoeba invadens IP1]|eukprot:XP_004255732.1 hypothetical protein EIN_491300 [Entamoeba invadens IP1]
MEEDLLHQVVCFLKTEKDASRFLRVSKKCRRVLSLFEYNPVTLTTVQSLSMFPNMKVQRLYHKSDTLLDGFKGEAVFWSNNRTLMKSKLPITFKNVRYERKDHDNCHDNIPPYIKQLAHGCFYYSQNTTITFPSCLSSIGADCFYYTPLRQVDLSRIAILDERSFGMCTSLSYIKPSHMITTIPPYCFQGCSSLTSFDLKVVERIGDSAFENCVSLKTIEISTNLSSISLNSFKKCTSLREVTGGVQKYCGDVSATLFKLFGDNKIKCTGRVFYIGDDKTVFGNIIPDGVNDQSCFFNDKVISLVIPNSVTGLCAHTFESCRKLREVQIPNGLTKLPKCCFNKCFKLEKINLVNIREIGSNCFNDCKKLDEIQIEGNVTLKDGCFEDCSSLSKVVISGKDDRESVFGKRVFAGCTSLEICEIKCNLKELDEETFFESGVKCIELPSCLTVLKKKCFSGCKELQRINLKHVESIEKGCFERCCLLEDIGFTVVPKSEEENPFADSPKLRLDGENER